MSSIKLLDSGDVVESAEIEPELLTNLFDSSREKRRKVRFDDIPPVMVNALLSAEDKRFFEHPGLDIVRIFGAAWADMRHEGIAQGASTLTMQVSRSFFFTTQRTWSRKVAETIVALELEHRFNKKQIFELYANEIYLGNRGSFAIHGFARRVAGLFQQGYPRHLGERGGLPRRHYSRAESLLERRPPPGARRGSARPRADADGRQRFITAQQARDAKKTPLHLVAGGMDNSDAPYFVDMVKDHLLDHFSEAELLSQSFRIYTTLDPALERAATQAFPWAWRMWISCWRASMRAGKGRTSRPRRKWPCWCSTRTPENSARWWADAITARASSITLLPAPAWLGVQALCLRGGVRRCGEGTSPVVTPATTVADEPTTFDFDGKEYTPNNYGEEFHGNGDAARGADGSLNVATVKVAEMIGYGRVVDMARQFGLDGDIQPTPAVALGAYDMTPLEVAAGVHGIRQWRHARRASVHRSGGRFARRRDRAQSRQDQASAGPARGLSGDHAAGGRDRSRNRRIGSRARIHGPGGGQDGNLARRLVRGLHV